jgi:hypothetical protein
MQKQTYFKDANDPSNFTSYRRYKSYLHKWNLTAPATNEVLSNYYNHKRINTDFKFVIEDEEQKVRQKCHKHALSAPINNKSSPPLHGTTPKALKLPPSSSNPICESKTDIVIQHCAIIHNKKSPTNETSVLPGQFVLCNRRMPTKRPIKRSLNFYSKFPDLDLTLKGQKLAVDLFKDFPECKQSSSKPISVEETQALFNTPQILKAFQTRITHTSKFNRRPSRPRRALSNKCMQLSRLTQKHNKQTFSSMSYVPPKTTHVFMGVSYFPSVDDPTMTSFSSYRAYKSYLKRRNLYFDQAMAFKVFMLHNFKYIRREMILNPKTMKGMIIRPLYTDMELQLLF